MKNYALLRLLVGCCNSLGLPEIRFHYPPANEREQQLFSRAINTINQYPFMVHYHWALVDEQNYDTFIKRLGDITKKPFERTIVPIDIMHGEIAFMEAIRLDGYTPQSKEQLVKKILDIGILPREDAMDLFVTRGRKERELCGLPFNQREWNKEIELTFARNLSFFSE